MTYTFKFLTQGNIYSEIYIGHLRLQVHLETQLTEYIVKMFCLCVYSNYITDYWPGKPDVKCTTFA
jgi:hypothetical protein